MVDIGRDFSDDSFAVAADGQGAAYLSIRTVGDLGSQNDGIIDVVLTKVIEVPEPTAYALALAATFFFIVRCRGSCQGKREGLLFP